jgi:hypothetical protein
MSRGFERFIAVDWSGAKGPGYRGIAVAVCEAEGPPRLVAPPQARYWARDAAVSWLHQRAADGLPTLAACDFAFSIAEAAVETLTGVRDAAALWSLVEATCAAEEDCGAHGFVAHPPYAPLFWTQGKRPETWQAHTRATEEACRAAGLGNPETPLKLIGAKQVGRSALTGMRALHRWQTDEAMAIWPFHERPAALTVVELYPRLFIRAGGGGNAKLRDGASLNACLARLGSPPVEAVAGLDDHATDALVSAAGLRHAARSWRDLWTPAGLSATAAQAEGWIFGVGARVS